jgi:hypothetical protein
MHKLFIRGSALWIAAALILSLSSAIHAEDPTLQPEGTAKTEIKPKFMPFRGKITAFDKIAMTLSLAGKEKARVFVITPETKMFKDAKPATLNDVAVGDEVGGRARITPDGKQEIITLRIGPKPEGQEKPAGTSEPKKAKKKPASSM